MKHKKGFIIAIIFLFLCLFMIGTYFVYYATDTNSFRQNQIPFVNLTIEKPSFVSPITEPKKAPKRKFKTDPIPLTQDEIEQIQVKINTWQEEFASENKEKLTEELIKEPEITTLKEEKIEATEATITEIEETVITETIPEPVVIEEPKAEIKPVEVKKEEPVQKLDPKSFYNDLQKKLESIEKGKTTPSIIQTEPKKEEIIPTSKIDSKVSIMVADVSKENIDSVLKYLKNNKNIGLAFNPNNYEAMKKASEEGFEVYLSVSMEPMGQMQLPQNTLLTTNDATQNIENLNNLLKTAYKPKGIMNYLGSKMTGEEYQSSLKPIMEELKKQNLAFVDAKTNPYSVADKVANETGTLYVRNQTFLSSKEPCSKEDCKYLSSLETKNKEVIAIGNYSGKFIKDLKTWLDNTNAKIIKPSSLIK